MTANCPSCDGEGETCARCILVEDGCNCRNFDALECPLCGGTGEVDVAVPEEDDD